MSQNNDDNTHFIEITSDVDEPPEEREMLAIRSDNISIKSLNSNTAENIEKNFKYSDKMEEYRYRRYGLNLLIGCGVAYVLLVIGDTLLSNFITDYVASVHLQGLVELLKFVISTLMGYVFAEKVKDK